MAVDVYEMVVLIAGSAVQGQRLSAQGLAGGGEPQLPFLWGLRFVVGVQQVVPAGKRSGIPWAGGVRSAGRSRLAGGVS